MKKYSIFMAAAALVLAVSCNKAEMEAPSQDVNSPVETELITVDLNPITKTSLNDKETLWSEGDAVSVTVGGKNLGSLTWQEGTIFSGEIEAGHDGDAILNYPAGVTAVPATQTAVENSFANGAALLEGTTTLNDLRAGESAISLQNKTALLKFTSARNGNVVFTVGEATYTVTGCEVNKEYYACIAPAAEALLSYTLGENEGAKSKTATFEAGKIYPLGALTEVFTPAPGNVYLKVTNNWKSDNARFAAYFFSQTWVSMTLVEGQTDIYQCAIPANEDGGMLFCRMDPNNTENRWNNDGETGPVWNKTIDLSLTDGCVYTLYDDSWDTGTWSGDPAVEKPVAPEVTPGQDSEWALVGTFSSWADKTMLTTEVADVVVLKNVTMKAAEGFLVRKPSTEWADKYGASSVNYLKSNHYITTSHDGADMCLEADGTYDIYFNTSTHNLYVMAAGADYTTATLQTASGKEPVQEEPEVTENILYFKANSNWYGNSPRCAAYFFNSKGQNTWVSMTETSEARVYEVHIPEGYTWGDNVIFCSMNKNTTTNNWNNKWNQTADLTIPTDGKNYFTANNGWDGINGTWSKK